jgi:hypothetical protein
MSETQRTADERTSPAGLISLLCGFAAVGLFIPGGLDLAGVVATDRLGEIALLTFASALAAIILGAIGQESAADRNARLLARTGLILGVTVFALFGLSVVVALMVLTGVFGGSG